MVSCESCGVVLSKVGGGLRHRCMGYEAGCCKEVTLCKQCRAEEPQREIRFRAHLRTCKYRLARLAALEKEEVESGDEIHPDDQPGCDSSRSSSGGGVVGLQVPGEGGQQAG